MFQSASFSGIPLNGTYARWHVRVKRQFQSASFSGIPLNGHIGAHAESACLGFNPLPLAASL